MTPRLLSKLSFASEFIYTAMQICFYAVPRRQRFFLPFLQFALILIFLASGSFGVAAPICADALTSNKQQNFDPQSGDPRKLILEQIVRLRKAIAIAQVQGEKALALTLAKEYKAKLDDAKKLNLLDGQMQVDLMQKERDRLDAHQSKLSDELKDHVLKTEKNEDIYLPWQVGTALPGAKKILQLDISPTKNNVLVTFADHTVDILNFQTGQKLYQIPPQTGNVTNTGFSANGLRFFTVDINRHAFVWDTLKGTLLAKLDLPNVKIFQSALNDAGTELAANCISDDGTSQRSLIFDVDAAKIVEVIKYEGLHSVSKLEFSPDGQNLLTLLGSGEALVDDIHSKKRVKLMESVERMSFIDGIKFSPNGEFILASGKKTGLLTLFHSADGKIARRFTGHSAKINSIKFNPNGERALTASVDGSVILWDISTGQPLQKFSNSGEDTVAADFIKDTDLIMTAAKNNLLQIWSALSGDVIHSLKGDAVTASALYPPTAAVSSDGNAILFNFPPNGLTVWKRSAASETK